MKKGEVVIVLIIAAAIFTFLCTRSKTEEHKPRLMVTPDLDKIVLDDSGRYIDPTFDKVVINKDIIFSSVPNEGITEDLEMDVYSPENDSLKSRPLIVWIHGGGFKGGDKSGGETVCTDLAKRGYVCASINYRLKADPTVDWLKTFSDAENDAVTAIKYLRSKSTQYGIDPNRIFLAGDSAGGDVALNAGFADYPIDTDADRGGVIGVINIYGSYLWNYIDTVDPPVLTIHGTNDETVPYQNSVSLTQSLINEGHENDIIFMYGIGHDYLSDYDEALSSMLYFTSNRLQVLNGAPFTYGQRTKALVPGDKALVSFKRNTGSEGFKGSVKIKAPDGWVVSGDTAIAGQSQLNYTVSIPESAAGTRLTLLYFDISDESGAFVSRLAVPIQITPPGFADESN